MKGDILIIGENHRKAASQVSDLIIRDIRQKHGKYFITVAGESGAGKSEIAAALAEKLEHEGIAAFIFQQDDYFIDPPKTNAAMRAKDINNVGMGEVRLALLNDTIESIIRGEQVISKPLVIFAEDRINWETVDLKPYRVIIIEGTYATALQNIDCRIFIDRNINDTREDRLKRNREKQDVWLEKILRIEHEIISGHKMMADIIISKSFEAIKVNHST